MDPTNPRDYRLGFFARIRDAKTKEEAQELALELWYHMHATQEGFACPGCECINEMRPAEPCDAVFPDQPEH